MVEDLFRSIAKRTAWRSVLLPRATGTIPSAWGASTSCIRKSVDRRRVDQDRVVERFGRLEQVGQSV